MAAAAHSARSGADPAHARRRPKWYLLYYLLAALDVFAVLSSLTLNHRMMQIYVDSVATSQQWENREERYAELAELARAVNAPGNDVFDSRDVRAESARMRAALGEFNAQFDSDRADIARDASAREAALLLPEFDEIEHAMREMASEAELIFRYFETGQARQAGERMATMDRKYAAFNQALARLSASVRTIQHAHFAEQIEAAGLLKRLEYLIMGLAILMVAGALWYGSRIYRAVRAAEAERSEHVEALARARAEADAANHAKSRFLAAMSHDIRTPMNTMFLTLDMLEDPAPAEERSRYLALARSSGRSLKRLIDDLLDLARIESGKIEFECVRFDLHALVRELVVPYAHIAEAKGVSLAVTIAPEVPAPVEGDPTRFGQLVSNLVDNAVKFTEAGSIEVSVSCRAEKPLGAEQAPGKTVPLRVAVRDTGIGLQPEHQARIFDDFVQADGSTSRKYGGTGLGLGIARRLIGLMNGEIGVRSAPGAGSTFWFDIDLAAGRSVPVPTPQSSHGGRDERLAGRRVLVVDDAAESRTLVAAALARLGMSVDVAADGSDAVSAAAASRYDAILMDIAMPVMDGLEATRRIREREDGGEEVPIIALTAQAMDGMIEECLDTGMDDYLAKPVTRDSLVAALRRWIEPETAELPS
jgi:signal transduction histidine kinase/ActR/RegA family two-component response regulator